MTDPVTRLNAVNQFNLVPLWTLVGLVLGACALLLCDLTAYRSKRGIHE